MKKLILGCLLALFASGCNDNEPEQKPVELKISFAGENPVEFTVGEQKRLAFTVTAKGPGNRSEDKGSTIPQINKKNCSRNSGCGTNPLRTVSRRVRAAP